MRNNRRLKPEQFFQFNQELSGLIRAGVPLPEGLRHLARELPTGRLKDAVEGVHSALERGEKLSDAIKATGGAFSDYYVSLLCAGEASGSMEDVLFQASRVARSRMRFYESLRLATIYPTIVGVVCIFITLFTVVYLMPRWEAIFGRIGMPLPPLTLFFIRIRNVLVKYPPILISVLGLLVLLWWWVVHTPRGRHLRELVLIFLPLTRRLFTSHLVETFARSLGTLLKANVPVDESLTLTRENLASSVAEPIIKEMQKAVRNGEPLTSVLEFKSPFPPSTTWMLSLAEERGDLDSALLDIADLYESKREFAYLQFIALAQPILIIIVGIVTGILVTAFYMPLFWLPRLIGRGCGY